MRLSTQCVFKGQQFLPKFFPQLTAQSEMTFNLQWESHHAIPLSDIGTLNDNHPPNCDFYVDVTP